ncbi:MAG: hypothetical protein BWY88_00925 [Synergistetes bacterium ADurb.Bin520]|nr:MAG: hypothetical protein BWY88_00925 [Synergistetes bacterium ADurb.Bin520]
MPRGDGTGPWHQGRGFGGMGGWVVGSGLAAWGGDGAAPGASAEGAAGGPTRCPCLRGASCTWKKSSKSSGPGAMPWGRGRGPDERPSPGGPSRGRGRPVPPLRPRPPFSRGRPGRRSRSGAPAPGKPRAHSGIHPPMAPGAPGPYRGGGGHRGPGGGPLRRARPVPPAARLAAAHVDDQHPRRAHPRRAGRRRPAHPHAGDVAAGPGAPLVDPRRRRRRAVPCAAGHGASDRPAQQGPAPDELRGLHRGPGLREGLLAQRGRQGGRVDAAVLPQGPARAHLRPAPLGAG